MDSDDFSRDICLQEGDIDANLAKVWLTEKDPSMFHMEHYVIKWSIENLNLLGEEFKLLTSPRFCHNFSKTEWFILLRPNFSSDGQKSMTFYIQRSTDDTDVSCVGVTFRFGVLDHDNKAVWFEEKKVREFKESEIVGFNVSRTEDLMNLTKYLESLSDTLVINCEMYVSYLVHNPSRMFPVSVLNYDLVSLSYDFYKLMHSKETCDYCIKIPHWDIRVHKAILTARSSVFEEILKYNASSAYVELQDISFSNLTNLILFMYSGNFNLVARNGPPDIGLYECARKYAVTELKNLLAPNRLHLRSKLENVELEFTWHIQNFSSRLKNAYNCIKSPTFKVDYNRAPQWTLTVCTISSSGILSSFDIFAEVDRETKALHTIMKISLLDKCDKLQNTKITTQSYKPNTKFGFSNFLIHFPVYNKLHGFLKNDTLKIHCHLTFVVSREIYDSHELLVKSCPYLSSFRNLADDLKRLYESSILTDLTLKIGVLNIRAHKSILYARSRSFVLLHLPSYTVSDSSKIPDIDPEILSLMINHAYTGDLGEISDENMLKLFIASEKLGFRSLMMICAQLLGEKINFENVCELIKVGWKMQNLNLLLNCSTFVRRNRKKLQNSPQLVKLKNEEEGAYTFLKTRIRSLQP